jgi:hypothetical protein
VTREEPKKGVDLLEIIPSLPLLDYYPHNSLIYGGHVYLKKVAFCRYRQKLQILDRRRNMPNRDRTGPPAGSQGPRDGRGGGKGGGRVGGRGRGIGAKKGGKKGSR